MASTSSSHEENQYLDLARRVIDHGQHRPDRTGTGTFTLTESTLPLLTTKRVFTKAIIHELLWFIRGSTSSLELSSKGVNIWNGNGSKTYLESVGLGHRDEGDLGPVYGFQWRHFGAKYSTCHDDYTGKGVDQLKECIEKIRNKPTDRRIILSAWNPIMIYKKLSRTLMGYNSPDEKHAKPRLSCILYQRSADIGLGLPFNIASYAILVHMIAQVTHTEAFELAIQLGDAHIYNDHLEPMKTQLERQPRQFPKIKLRGDVDDIDGFVYEDFEVVDYDPHPKIEMAMSV